MARALAFAHSLAVTRPHLLRSPRLALSSCSVTPTMRYSPLGDSGLRVSDVCLGSMTWGVQNSEAEAHAQIDYAISRGVNFIDTAEMYPTPSSSPTQVPGTTERFIGTYLAKHPDVRSKLIIATKVTGFNRGSKTAANRTVPPTPAPLPDARLDRQSILLACDASLRRLQTDYIDLYQLHWPDRYVPLFGDREYRRAYERDSVPFRETLLALKHLLDTGKIRAYGLSNESTFGVCQIVQIAQELGMPRPASIQNSYCLLNRSFEYELAEACSPRNFNIPLLPWSPLAGGVLSGKYNNKTIGDGTVPPDPSLRLARYGMFPSFQGRFTSPAALRATLAYTRIAEDLGISLTTLSLAFCKSREYVASSIIGATTLDQLKEDIDAFELDLKPKDLSRIDQVHNNALDCILGV